MSMRTEKEKMLAGEIYNYLDPTLDAERQIVEASLRRYNLTETQSERLALLSQLLVQPR